MANLIDIRLWILLLCCIPSFISADTPANCTYEDVRGTWTFHFGPTQTEKIADCTSFKAVRQAKFTMHYMDLATDEFGNKGFWTMIYNQGFEVVVAGRKYFGFSKYVGKSSFCNQVDGGWSHDVLGNDWACYNAVKDKGVVKTSPKKTSRTDTTLRFESQRLTTDEMVEKINFVQKSWTATHYPQFDGLSRDDLIRMAGGKASRIASKPRAVPLNEHDHRIMAELPTSFDWRNVSGINYVSPIRNQESCGSCYAFASMAMMEARVRIETKNEQQPVFSPQDVVECSHYSQGCEGGFPYLVAGKYAEDFGVVLEECNPYKGVDGKCSTKTSCERQYATNYNYVGGYYGNCNEARMMEAVYKRGPIAVSFEVYDDFRSYKSGIYHHVTGLGVKGGFNPWEITSHVVVVVGWGQDESSGQKYWIVKNSWGRQWGLDGFFWIRKGNDECGLESMAAESAPIIKF